MEAWCKIAFGDSNSNPLYNGADLYLNNQKVTNLTIPTTITQIKAYTFYGCKSLTSVTIHNSVTSIGSSAFYKCENLATVINNSKNITVTKGSTSNGYVGYYATSVTNPS